MISSELKSLKVVELGLREGGEDINRRSRDGQTRLRQHTNNGEGAREGLAELQSGLPFVIAVVVGVLHREEIDHLLVVAGAIFDQCEVAVVDAEGGHDFPRSRRLVGDVQLQFGEGGGVKLGMHVRSWVDGCVHLYVCVKLGMHASSYVDAYVHLYV